MLYCVEPNKDFLICCFLRSGFLKICPSFFVDFFLIYRKIIIYYSNAFAIIVFSLLLLLILALGEDLDLVILSFEVFFAVFFAVFFSAIKVENQEVALFIKIMKASYLNINSCNLTNFEVYVMPSYFLDYF